MKFSFYMELCHGFIMFIFLHLLSTIGIFWWHLEYRKILPYVSYLVIFLYKTSKLLVQIAYTLL